MVWVYVFAWTGLKEEDGKKISFEWNSQQEFFLLRNERCKWIQKKYSKKVHMKKKGGKDTCCIVF